jgi:hypothetical protein
MAKITMTVEQASILAKSIVSGRKRWGLQYTLPVLLSDLLDALVVLDSAGNFDGPTQAELNLTKRQLTAALAREAKLRKQLKGEDDGTAAEEPATL